jgi:hypothetical protein
VVSAISSVGVQVLKRGMSLARACYLIECIAVSATWPARVSDGRVDGLCSLSVWACILCAAVAAVRSGTAVEQATEHETMH